jgi:hypothetical protein
MKHTMIRSVAQALLLAMSIAISGSLISCSSRGAANVPPPVDPEAAVRGFLHAVSANSLTGMGQLWGTSEGPAAGNMDRTTLEQRLTVIRIYLEHEEFAFVPGDPVAGVNLEAGERAVFVQLTRRGCTPMVPFTLVPYRGGWLIRSIDLASAGNPSRRCRPGSPLR